MSDPSLPQADGTAGGMTIEASGWLKLTVGQFFNTIDWDPDASAIQHLQSATTDRFSNAMNWEGNSITSTPDPTPELGSEFGSEPDPTSEAMFTLEDFSELF